ncbi:hypothetical protein HID58_095544 [Brassica napus]|uniref:RIN4 pathogenic type III effector avirulence factor Avr cleavage site domain-containing protein n=1 Tax=Brassica napus TaxID=3708 RepID=A0ABQ7X372_BRANA|nr:hypothetical protein HID58_095544 [Brassica napus]
MLAENKGRPLPKFGEWDVNNPASAEGFTVIFSKASDEKKTKKASGAVPNSQRNQNSDQNNHHDSQIQNLRRNGFASVDSCLLLKNPRIMKLNKVNPQEATHLSRLDPIHLQTEAPINVEREDQTTINLQLKLRHLALMKLLMSVTMKMSKTFKNLLGKLRSQAENLTSFLRADIKVKFKSCLERDRCLTSCWTRLLRDFTGVQRRNPMQGMLEISSRSLQVFKQ